MVLAQESCLPCRDRAPILAEAELAELLPQLPGWGVVNGHHLQKAWSFADFQQALAWLNRAGAICEAEGHHAQFTLGWGHASAEVYTHKVDGLTRADVVLAAKLEGV